MKALLIVRRISKKKSETDYDVKKVPIAAVSQAAERVVIDFTLLIQISCGYHLLFARENDLCKSCLKSPSQIRAFALSSLKKK